MSSETNHETSIVLLDATLAEREDRAINSVLYLANVIARLKSAALTEGEDYGVIPGTGDKPTLLLPGMEKLMRAINAEPIYIEREVIRDYDKPLFHYEYECRLIDVDTGKTIPGGRGIGLCNSYEASFRWRWVKEDALPEGVDKSKLRKRGGMITEYAFAIDKGETAGKWGKPAEYWQVFRDAIKNGTAVSSTKTMKGNKQETAWSISGWEYQIENPDVFDQINAIAKRAKKRALGDAIKGAANVSQLFTVDLEDFAPHVYSGGDTVDGAFEIVTPQPRRQPQTLPQMPTDGSSALQPDPQPDPSPIKIVEPQQTPQEQFKSWIASTDGQAKVAELMRNAGHTHTPILAKLGVSRFSEWAGGNSDAFLKRMGDIIAELNQPAKPKAAPPVEDPVSPVEPIVSTFKYDGRKFSFETEVGVINYFKGRREFIAMIGEEYAAAYGVTDKLTPSSEPRPIGELLLQWETNASGFKQLVMATPINAAPERPETPSAPAVKDDTLNQFFGEPQSNMEIGVD